MHSFHRTLVVIAASAIFVTGLVMIFNTTSAERLDLGAQGGSHTALLKQILYGALGCWLAAFAWAIGYRPFLKLSPWLFSLATFALLLVFVPGIGRSFNGSHRWIGLTGLTLQPSEFAKLALLAFFVHKAASEIPLSFGRFLSLSASLALPLLLILISPDHGTVAVMGACLAALCFLMGIPWRYWALPLVICLFVGSAIALHTPYVRARLEVYLHPELDLLGKGHQPYQAKIAAGSGGIFGKGPGNSWQKLSYLPEAQNDYIAAIYAEEFGFVGILFLLVCYMVLAYAGGMIAVYAPDRQGCFLAMAITFLLCFQAFLNLGVVSGMLPSTGLNLPLFSQGGSSLIANVFSLGLLISILDSSTELSCKKNLHMIR